jgi:ABC-type phosphate/phosphonate transport system substrate-binding protein
MRAGGCLLGVAVTVSLLIGLQSGIQSGIHAGEPIPTSHRAAPVRIGMIDSLFQDVPQSTVLAFMQPFGAIMEAQTGVSGELVPGGDVAHLAQQIVDDKLQLGVFHGIEFAWARQKHPELRALAIAVNQHVYLRAVLIVKTDSKASSMRDLQGKTIALARGTREHCVLYLDRCCEQCNKGRSVFFAKVTTPNSAEEAIDDVIDGEVDAAIVDGLALDCYKRRKPGRYAKIRPAQISEPFPTAAVVYKNGAIDEALLKRFREGLMNANRSIMGRQIFTLFKLTSFEPVPKDYDQVLADIAKAYPQPAHGK